MPYYRQVGDVPRKRHTQFRQPDGSLYAEELMGVEGFSSDSALLYHRQLPTAIVSSEVYDAPRFHRRPNHPLKPRHFKTHKLDGAGAAEDPVLGRQHLLANADVRVSYVGRRPAVAAVPQRDRRRVRVRRERQRGRRDASSARSRSSAGDYVVIPTSTTHRWVPRGDRCAPW